ncbi:MAG TPA: TetR/AcrR family transcriptional regulator [Terriglobales bacterium]
MGIKERREREKTETREIILDAARELFITEGYEGVSMRKVAEKIEYSPTAIYVHFKDKDDLFHELCHEDYARLAAEFQSANLPSDPIERIRAIGQTYINFGLHYPNHFKLMFMTPNPQKFSELDERDKDVKGNPEKDSYAFLMQTVHEALAMGVFRDELKNADLIAQTLWAAVHGVVALQIAKSHDAWVDWQPIQERVQVMLDSTLRGLLKESK